MRGRDVHIPEAVLFFCAAAALCPRTALATVSADNIHWAQALPFGDEIRRANVNGDNAAPLLAWPEVSDPIAIAVDHGGGKIYWAQTFEDRVLRADLTGDNVELVLSWLEVDNVVGIALDLEPKSLGIPTASEWGMITMAVLLLTAGAFMIVKRPPRLA